MTMVLNRKLLTRTPRVKITIAVYGVTLPAAGVTKLEVSIARITKDEKKDMITPASSDFAGSKTANFKIVKGKTSFKAKASKTKVKKSMKK